jgi:hypothetical protein
LWGQGFDPAAELLLGAELYASSSSAGDPVAGARTNRVLNGSVRAVHRSANLAAMDKSVVRVFLKPISGIQQRATYGVVSIVTRSPITCPVR